MVIFSEFYNKVKEKVTTLLKEQEIPEGDLRFEKIVGEVIKEFMIKDGDIQRKQIIPRDKQNYPTKNILRRVDSKIKLDTKMVGIK